MALLKKLGEWVDRVVFWMIVAIFTVLICACVLQVITRVAGNALSWTEELARYTFIWVNMLGAAVCVRKGSHATVTALVDVFPRSLQRVIRVLVQVIIILVAFVMVYYGAQVAHATRMQTSAALKLNMSLVNAAVPVSGAFIVVHALLHLVNNIMDLFGRSDDKVR